jgi:hypothetical protein
MRSDHDLDDGEILVVIIATDKEGTDAERYEVECEIIVEYHHNLIGPQNVSR